MNNRLKIVLIVTIVFISIAITLLLSSTPKVEKNSQKALTYTNWKDEFSITSKEPKGLFHFNSMLRLLVDKKQQISTIDYLYSIDTIKANTKPTFIFIGNHFVLYEEEIDTILSKVKAGSQLYISSNTIDGAFYKKIFESVQLGFYYDTIIHVATQSNTYHFTAKNQQYAIAKEWYGYKKLTTKDSLKYKALSGYGNLTNSIMLEYGQGKVYLNTSPELFVNYLLLTNDGLGYGKHWFNTMPKHQSIYWLKLANFSYKNVNSYGNESEENDTSYLQFIFQNRYRNIAILLLMVGLVLFVLFRAKRIQPVIPLSIKKQNMSLLFAETIASIYFNKREPFALIRIQKSNFYSIVLKSFNIDLSKGYTDKELLSLAQKSKVPITEIRGILQRFEMYNSSNSSEKELLTLRKRVLDFYYKSGIVSVRVHERILNEVEKIYRNEWISTAYLLFGCFTIVLGMYYLVQSIGSGVLLWPIGLLLVIIGFARLMNPYLKITKSDLIIQPLLGKEKQLNLEQIIAVEQTDKYVKLTVKDKEILINYKTLNANDAKRLKNFVEMYNKLM